MAKILTNIELREMLNNVVAFLSTLNVDNLESLHIEEKPHSLKLEIIKKGDFVFDLPYTGNIDDILKSLT